MKSVTAWCNNKLGYLLLMVRKIHHDTVQCFGKILCN
jgi:hypothetical protein